MQNEISYIDKSGRITEGQSLQKAEELQALRYVRGNNQVNNSIPFAAKCYVLWQQLYSKTFWSEGNITISKSDLADRYKISETRAKKYLKELVGAGYLKVTKKYIASQITICLPQKFVELLKAAPSINEEEDFT